MSDNMTATEKVQQEIALQNEWEKYLTNHPNELSLKYLILHQLPVYVKSNSRVENGVILVEIPPEDSNGKKVAMQIGSSSIPIELTARASHAALARSFHLRKLLDDGMLTLIDPTEARLILQDPANRRRHQKLTASLFSKNSEEFLPDSYSRRPLADTANVQPGAPVQDVTTGTVSNRLKGLVLSVQEKNVTVDEFIDTVSDSSKSYSIADWNFIKTELPNEPDVQSMVAAEINARNNQSIPMA